jgi:4a-hydroxytetrahydrobiopterin dehydratase
MSKEKEKEKVYSDDEVAARTAELGLGEWKLEDGWLRRKISTDGWQTTLQVVNLVTPTCR